MMFFQEYDFNDVMSTKNILFRMVKDYGWVTIELFLKYYSVIIVDLSHSVLMAFLIASESILKPLSVKDVTNSE